MEHMTDMTITRGHGVAEVEGETERGVEFLDAYTAIDLFVVDAGRIIIPESGLWALKTRAREAGLS